MLRLPIDRGRLAELIKQCKHRDIAPIDLPAEIYTARSGTVSRLSNEILEECKQLLSIMSDEEVRTLVDNLPPSFKMNIDQDTSREIIAIYCLSAMVEDGYLSFRNVVSQTFQGSELWRVYPEIGERLDDDGLLYVNDDFKLLDGGIQYQGHILHYHQLLRRGYTAGPNLNFLYTFRNYYYQTKDINQFRIAIDYQRLMPREEYAADLEKDWWFGPRFSYDQLDSPYAVGLTVVQRNKLPRFDLIYKLDRTEFFWSFKNETKTLQLEELSRADFIFEPYYLNRYVHCERNVTRQTFNHVDGAIKVYLMDKYPERLRSLMPDEPRSYRKVKLFRIDGGIEADDWMALVSLFLVRNEMVFEYFNPEQFEQEYGEEIRAFMGRAS